MDNRTEQLADGVWRIDLSFWVSAYVLANDGHSDREGLTVVDTGTRGMAPRLVRSIRMLGLDPRAVGDVLLTHWHVDHTGGARRFTDSSASPRVWIGDEDLPVLTGERRPADMVGDCTRLGGVLHRYAYQAPTPVPEARALPDGHVHPAAGGTHVLATPGHTHGHRALHLPARGVLIAGDAVMTLGRLAPSVGLLCSARSKLRDSIARMAELDFDVLAPMHGPPIDKRARQRLAALVA